jgi:hypothetical protein
VRFHEAAGLLLDISIGVILLRALRAPELIVLTGSAPTAATLANLFTLFLKIGFIVCRTTRRRDRLRLVPVALGPVAVEARDTDVVFLAAAAPGDTQPGH